MSSGRRSASAKRGLLAGAALAVLTAAGAQAAPFKVVTPKHAPLPASPRAAAPVDGLAQGELYMESDLVIRDDKNKVSTARGDVEVRYDGRTLRAQELVYEEVRGVMTARGQVTVINTDGTVEYADEMVVDDDMKAGVAVGFAARLQQNVKIASATAVRRSENINELNRAIYTPCEVCAKDGSPRKPTWSVKADRVVQDKKRRLIYYRNATILVKGVPLLYLPVFWHADPTAGRHSGFLTPDISFSDRRGLSYEQPYLQALSPSSDITLSPQINTKVNPFLNGHYRKRFYSGDLDVRFGYTHDKDFDSQGRQFGDDTSRSYVLARGAFRVDEKWRWGFTAERASEDYVFDKYEIGKVYESRGPYIADDRRLISQVYAVRQDQQSYFSTAAFSIQGLRPTDNDRTFPVVAPLVEARWEPSDALLGGRLRVRGSAVALTREQAVGDVAPADTPGLDSRRGTGELDWRTAWTAAAGLRVEPFVVARADAYSLGDLPGSGRSKSLSRAMAVAGADVSWPFYKRLSDATVVLEPLVQFAVSPDAKQIVVGYDSTGAPVYLDEDSQAFEFDESTLFQANKFPGYDLYEDGVRLNAGGRASVLWDDGRRASLLIGRSFRDGGRDIFASRTGLSTRASDWIVAADAQPMRGLSLFGRARLDSDTLDVRRAEFGANVAMKRGSGFVRYLTDNTDINGRKTQNLDIGGDIRLTRNWGITAYGNRDLEQAGWVVRDVGVYYTDECIRVDVIYRREDTVLGRLGPSDSVGVRLTLATLGER